MKVVIQEKPASSLDGSIFLEFWRGHIVNVLLIMPSVRPGFSWCVTHPGHNGDYSHFHTIGQARQFALVAAVHYFLGRPIPTQ